jgi:hypothetical protein
LHEVKCPYRYEIKVPELPRNHGTSELRNFGTSEPLRYPISDSPRIPYITSPNEISVVGTTIASSVKKTAA